MKQDLFSAGVPFVAGGVVALLLGFGTGLFTATSTSRTNVALARIDERASMCFDAATAAGLVIPETFDRTFADEYFITTGDRKTDTLIQEACLRKLRA